MSEKSQVQSRRSWTDHETQPVWQGKEGQEARGQWAQGKALFFSARASTLSISLSNTWVVSISILFLIASNTEMKQKGHKFCFLYIICSAVHALQSWSTSSFLTHSAGAPSTALPSHPLSPSQFLLI